MPQLQLIATPQSHTEPAWSVAFNPKRSLLASCSTDKTVRLYSYSLPSGSAETTTHQHGAGCSHSHSESPAAAGPSFPSPTSDKPIIHHIKTIQTEHKRTIRSLAWAPSGRTLATGSFDSSVAVWEEVDGEGDGLEEGGEGQEGVYKPETIKSNGGDADTDEEEVEGRADGIKEVKDWECVTTLEGHESECKAVGWSADGALLASCSRDKSVWVWEVQPDSDFECIAVLMEHSQDVKTLAWHTSEEILASASYDSHIHVQWDDPDGDWCIFQKLHPKLPVKPVFVPRPDTTKATPSSGEILAYNSLVTAIMPTAEEREAESHLNVPPLVEDETVWSLAWSPCGRYLASGGDLGGIRIWARTGNNPDSLLAEVLHSAAHSRSCFTLSWSAGGASNDSGGLGILASAGADGKVIVWQVSALTEASEAVEVNQSAAKKRPQVRVTPLAAVRDAHGVADVNCVAWLQREGGEGQGVLASCADDGSVKVWRVVSDGNQ